MSGICVICGEKVKNKVCECGFDFTKYYDAYRTLIKIHAGELSTYQKRKNHDAAKYGKGSQAFYSAPRSLHNSWMKPKESIDYFAAGKSYYAGNNYEDAFECFKKEAEIEGGNPAAKNYLGYMYQFGQGVEQNYKEAANWYKKAAESGNVFAMNNIGLLYKNGNGVEKSDKEAEYWFNRSSNSGMRKKVPRC